MSDDPSVDLLHGVPPDLLVAEALRLDIEVEGELRRQHLLTENRALDQARVPDDLRQPTLRLVIVVDVRLLPLRPIRREQEGLLPLLASLLQKPIVNLLNVHG